MPKTIIREFDNSKTGIALSSNFAVFVPGYSGAPKLKSGETAEDVLTEAKKAGIYYEADKIYRLNSQAQFIRYIGKFGGDVQEAVAPTLEEINLNAEGWERYIKNLKVSEFELQGAYYYKWDTVSTDTPIGHLVVELQNGENSVIRVRLTRVSTADLYEDLERNVEGETVTGITTNTYCKIKVGNEGRDQVGYLDEETGELQPIDHDGNQIAYELLGLGYTVYFRALSKTESAVTQLREPEFWSPLKNKSTYRIRYITTGGCYDASVAHLAAGIAEFNNSVKLEDADTYNNETGRGDCIALLDIDEDYTPDGGLTYPIKEAITQTQLLTAFGAAAGVLPSSKYCAIFAPRVVYKLPEDSVYSSNTQFPCSFHYLACAAQAQKRYAEWYAVAGYTRGISSYSIAYTTHNFGDIAINTLAPRTDELGYTNKAINLILNERGNYYLWGNRTAEPLTSDGLIFSHFLNIRQLCCTIKQVLYEATRRFTFDPNSDLLWINFVNAIRPTLENMKADQGIRGYRISRVETDKKAVLVAKIRIVPIEAVEDFDISIYLEDSLSGIVIDANEEVAE